MLQRAPSVFKVVGATTHPGSAPVSGPGAKQASASSANVEPLLLRRPRSFLVSVLDTSSTTQQLLPVGFFTGTATGGYLFVFAACTANLLVAPSPQPSPLQGTRRPLPLQEFFPHCVPQPDHNTRLPTSRIAHCTLHIAHCTSHIARHRSIALARP